MSAPLKPQDISGTTNAGSNTVASPEASQRRYLEYFNCSDTDQWANWGGAATAGKGSTKYAPGTGYIWQGPETPSSSFNLFCASAKDYTLKEG
jgi:hypothetical protein